MTHWAPSLAAAFAIAVNSQALACPMCGGPPAGNDGSTAGFNTAAWFMIGGLVGCLLVVIRTIIKGIRGSVEQSPPELTQPSTTPTPDRDRQLALPARPGADRIA